MVATIYVITDSDDLLPLTEAPYNSEAVLQELLAKYPSLLAGEQVDSSEPRRWLLVRREVGVPDESERRDRWSVDHLFLDQDGVPTIVEVKRSADTRIRREVVGQMLDYAANAVTYWPVERLRAEFEQTCQTEGIDPSEALAAALGAETDEEAYWQRVKTSLQAGRVRMVFVSDHIPPDLRRVVEFLNQQMDPAQVLALEIKQFAGEGLRTLLPRVIGVTAQSEAKRGSRDRRKWDEESFFAELARRRGDTETRVGRRLWDWARSRNLRIWWGAGRITGSMYPVLDHGQTNYSLFSLWTNGNVTIEFESMSSRPPLSDETVRKQVAQRLNEIPGVQLPADSPKGWPRFPLSALSEPSAVQLFLRVFDWVIALVRPPAPE